MNYKLIVPYDFTDAAKDAYLLAREVAKKNGNGITLLHVVKDKDEIAEAKVRLNKAIEELQSDVPVVGQVTAGSIFNDIGRVAQELESGLISMGTHGLKGMQYLIGSNAIRVVTNSNVPFVITQPNQRTSYNIKNIVVPIDMLAEEKVVLSTVVKAAELFDANVQLFVAKHNDDFQNNAVKRNLTFSKKYLSDNNIRFDTHHAEDVNDFNEQLIDFCEQNSTDLISIINHREDGIKNLFSAGFDQKIITNKLKIPVLIVNTQQYAEVKDIFRMFS